MARTRFRRPARGRPPYMGAALAPLVQARPAFLYNGGFPFHFALSK